MRRTSTKPRSKKPTTKPAKLSLRISAETMNLIRLTRRSLGRGVSLTAIVEQCIVKQLGVKA